MLVNILRYQLLKFKYHFVLINNVMNAWHVSEAGNPRKVLENYQLGGWQNKVQINTFCESILFKMRAGERITSMIPYVIG